MSTLVFVDPESFTQAEGAQSSRVPVPLPEDPYEAIRHAYLDGTNTEFAPFEDPIDTETPESPLAIAPPIPLSKSTPPILVPILRRTARMAVRVPHAMSSGLSASMAEVVAMSESALRKRFRSSYESLPSVSPPDLPSRKSYRGTFELVKDRDEGPTTEDKDLAVEDEGLTAGVEVRGMDDEGYGLEDESHGRDDKIRGIDDEGHSVESDGLGLEEEEEAVPAGSFGYGDDYKCTFRTWGSGSTPESERPERTSGSLLISPSHYDVPSPISLPIIPLTIPSPESTPATVETEGFLTELGAQVEMQRGLILDHAVRLEELSPALFERSLEYEQERVAVTFRAIWRPVLALEAWAGQTDAQRAALWHAISDVQGENWDLRLQLAEER
ncbi:hypothetical protein Tco_0476034 [Tanacetum coccineum]